jgi:hypothetical protein
MVVCVAYPDNSVGEVDISHLWPAIPRRGETFQWRAGDTEWVAPITAVVWHAAPGGHDADVWLDTVEAERWELYA